MRRWQFEKKNRHKSKEEEGLQLKRRCFVLVIMHDAVGWASVFACSCSPCGCFVVVSATSQNLLELNRKPTT